MTILSTFVLLSSAMTSPKLWLAFPHFSDHYLLQVAEEVASEEENAVEEVEAPAEESSPQ